MDWKEWFERNARSFIKMWNVNLNKREIGPNGMECPEEMYQAFKARLIDELRVPIDDHTENQFGNAKLIDTGE